MSDIVERLRERGMDRVEDQELACGWTAINMHVAGDSLCAEAAAEIERLRTELARSEEARAALAMRVGELAEQDAALQRLLPSVQSERDTIATAYNELTADLAAIRTALHATDGETTLDAAKSLAAEWSSYGDTLGEWGEDFVAWAKERGVALPVPSLRRQGVIAGLRAELINSREQLRHLGELAERDHDALKAQRNAAVAETARLRAALRNCISAWSGNLAEVWGTEYAMNRAVSEARAALNPPPETAP